MTAEDNVKQVGFLIAGQSHKLVALRGLLVITLNYNRYFLLQPRSHTIGGKPKTLPAKIVRQMEPIMRRLIFFLFFLALSINRGFAQQYDLVLAGGRVMDPETGLDAERNVGIRDGKIVRISSETLSGRRV